MASNQDSTGETDGGGGGAGSQLGLDSVKGKDKKPSRSKLTFITVDALLSPAAAESIGIPLTDDVAARELAEQATFRIRTLLQTAQKYSMHAKRRKMNAEDLDLALKAQGQEPLYGLYAAEHIPFRSGLFSRLCKFEAK